MAGYLIRTVIAIFMFLIVMALVPLVLAEIGFGIGSNLLQIIRLVGIALAILYILWGPTPPWPGRSA